jgi:hypothetical protein
VKFDSKYILSCIRWTCMLNWILSWGAIKLTLLILMLMMCMAAPYIIQVIVVGATPNHHACKSTIGLGPPDLVVRCTDQMTCWGSHNHSWAMEDGRPLMEETRQYFVFELTWRCHIALLRTLIIFLGNTATSENYKRAIKWL